MPPRKKSAAAVATIRSTQVYRVAKRARATTSILERMGLVAIASGVRLTIV